ncbi:MAG: DUF4340 domain-containing protein [candidate division Zixibacteria bacterium]
MNENKTTLWFAVAAAVLLIIAVIASPDRITPSAFQDQGEPFFPDFNDPNTAAILEIVEFDNNTETALPFKVTFTKNRWSIPSHHDYPADNKDRLARIASGIIGITRDDFRSDNIADHESCGAIDPLDESNLASSGYGTRVTIKDIHDNILADLIIGIPVEGGQGFRFVRLPDEKRVYAVKTSIDISTKFEDWIDTDLLQVDNNKINRLSLHDYSIDERSGRLNEHDKLILYKKDDDWTARDIGYGKKVDSTKLSELKTAIDNLKIVGVRPKPAGLSQNLKKMNQEGQEINRADLMNLQGKGFYFTRDGELKSNEGELIVRTDEGVVYTLRFGEILYGTGLSVTAGTEEGDTGEGSAENRYLFITTEFDQSAFTEPPKPNNTDFLTIDDSLWTNADRENKTKYDVHEKWHKNVTDGRILSETLNARFADWYYVISSESFDKLNLSRKDLITNKE